MLEEIKKHLLVYKAFVKNSMVKQMTYRFNFFLMMIVECAFLVWKLLYTFVISGTNVSLNGIDSQAMFLFSGSFILMTGVYLALFYFNFSNMQQLIGDGTLDFYMVKPISLQFMVTLRTIDLGTTLPNIIGGLAILTYGWIQMKIPFDLIHVGGYLFFFICGLLTAYSVMLIPQLLNFIIIRGWAIRELSDAIWDSNSMPMTIYSQTLRFVGTYVLPLFVISNYASMFALGKLTILNMFWGALTPIVFFIIARFIWKKMLVFYISASS